VRLDGQCTARGRIDAVLPAPVLFCRCVVSHIFEVSPAAVQREVVGDIAHREVDRAAVVIDNCVIVRGVPVEIIDDSDVTKLVDGRLEKGVCARVWREGQKDVAGGHGFGQAKRAMLTNDGSEGPGFPGFRPLKCLLCPLPFTQARDGIRSAVGAESRMIEWVQTIGWGDAG